MMKRIYSAIAGMVLMTSVVAQAPQKMSYQAVIRNNSNVLLTSAAVGMKISILQGSASGTAVYVETQTPNTNANGLVSIAIGTGTVVTGTFTAINWAVGPYFIKTETDPTGGTAYTITGTSQMLSVPYALYAENAKVGGFTHYLGEAFNGGIIYYLYKGSDGLEHGLIVALTETAEVWQTAGTLVNANHSEDGVYNTNLMTNSGAATYTTGLGSGWYLPSIDELALLYDNRYSVQKSLRAGGYTLLSANETYWSSYELNATTAVTFRFGLGDDYPYAKVNYYLVRAIRAF